MHNLKEIFNSLPRNARWAVILVGVVVLWMATGIFNGNDNKNNDSNQKPEIKTVTAQALKATDFDRKLKIIARSAADELVQLSAQISGGEVISTPAQNGDHVKKGDVLVQIDLGTRQESVNAAKASVKAAKILVKAAHRLSKEGFKAATTVAQREAELAIAERELADAQFALDHTKITAPSNGIVENIMVKKGDYVSGGDPIVKFLNTERFLIVGHAAQKDRDSIIVGQTAKAILINGTEIEGTIRFVARDADDTTRTYRVELLVDGTVYPNFSTGMSAELIVSTGIIKAFLIPHSALIMDDQGNVGVMLAKNGITAEFHTINMINDTPNGVWVEGLPDEIILVTRGQSTLVDGEKIKVKLIQNNE